MSVFPPFARRLLTSLPLAAAMAVATGCSSTGDFFQPDAGIDGPYSGGDDEDGYDGAETSSGGDPDNGGSGDEGGADDGGGELPPAADEEGIDHGGEPEACDAESEVTLFISPDDSNSMSSPVQAREAVLSDWGSVQSVAIRTWEFFNYYTFGYPAAAEAGQVAITPSLLQPEDGTEGDYLLQIGVSSHQLSAQTRDPINVTLVLDTSGSMAGHPMEMLRETSWAIASSLREGDVISIVTWSTDNATVLDALEVSGPDDPELLGVIDNLATGGGTDLHGGLVAGYELAEQQRLAHPGRIDRIVLVSDGGANAGITDIDLIAEHAGGAGEDGIYMVGVGVGSPLSYYDDLMDSVTDAGKGASVFVASADEARTIFDDDFISTMDVAARDVQVRLELPPGFEIVRTSAEEVSADPSEVEPQHLAPNDAMVFHQHIRTCAPDLVTEDTPLTVAVRYLDARTFEPHELEYATTFGELLAADPAPLLKGAAVFTYAESLKAYKKADQDGRISTMAGAFEALERAEAVLPGDPELAEIRSVLEVLSQ